MMALTFRGISLERGLGRIDFGMALLAVPVLQGIGFCLEAFGWRGILASLGARVSFRAVLRVRIVSEALSQSIPLGVLFAEGSKPLLLRTRTGVAIPTGAASVAARKYSLVVTQALLLAAIALFGGPAIDRLGARLPGGPATLRVIVAAGAIVLALSASASRRALGGGAIAERVRGLLARLPLVGSFAARHHEEFTEADVAAARYFRRSLGERCRSAAPFLLAWCAESLETWFLLRLVGVDLGLGAAFCLEVPLGLLRSVAFFTPAGLGIQDLGYATALASLGVPDATAAALGFVLLKRCKETLWVAVGYALLVSGRPAREPAECKFAQPSHSRGHREESEAHAVVHAHRSSVGSARPRPA